MDSRTPFFISVVLHLAVILVMCFGLPSWRNAVPQLIAPIPVELVTIGKETMAPKIDPLPQKGEEVPTKAPVEPPKIETPPPVLEPKPESKPEPAPKPEPEPKPEPAVTPEVKPEVKPMVKPEVKPEKPKKDEKKKDDKKPTKKKEKDQKDVKKDKPDDSFESLLKNLDTSKPADDEGEIDDKNPPKPARKMTGKVGDSITLSQLDAVQRQIGQCWILTDVKGAKNIDVPVRIFLNAGGVVQDAQLVDPGKLSDPHYRALAESALRAAKDPRCGPLELPADQYDTWKVIRIIFNADKML